jgi:hypothetical protein
MRRKRYGIAANKTPKVRPEARKKTLSAAARS